MKFILTLVICNAVCAPAFEWPQKFDSFYDCARIGANIEDWSVSGRYYSLAENCLDTASAFTKET